MSSRSYERRTERATAEEVAEVERQLWEFAKRIDPPSVPEAKLRPGAFLWRVHRTWHDLGRGTGGLASRSFRALRDELLERDPPVRNLQPKLYGNTTISQAEAEQLIDVMLETWQLERGRNGKWQARALTLVGDKNSAGSHDLEAIRENLLHTLFRGDDQLLLEEPVGVPPEMFFEDRGRDSLALIIPTKGETTAHLSPTNLYSSFSKLVGGFFDAAAKRSAVNDQIPLLIWVLRLRAIRDNSKFHTAFDSLVSYSGCLTNWFFRMHYTSGADIQEARKRWQLIESHCAFVVYGMPDRSNEEANDRPIDEDLAGVEPDTFQPDMLPEGLSGHRLIRRHRAHDFGMNVSIEAPAENAEAKPVELSYWLFPDRPTGDLEETADTTGMFVFDADMSPGRDFDIAFTAIFEAVSFRLGLAKDKRSRQSFNTLSRMGWQILDVKTFQEQLCISQRWKSTIIGED